MDRDRPRSGRRWRANEKEGAEEQGDGGGGEEVISIRIPAFEDRYKDVWYDLALQRYDRELLEHGIVRLYDTRFCYTAWNCLANASRPTLP